MKNATRPTLDIRYVAEVGLTRFVTDASEQGIAPGAFPQYIDVPAGYGNGMPFVKCGFSGCFGMVESVQYAQVGGCRRLSVLND